MGVTLVTGATGFLGGAIVQALAARGERVKAFCRRATPELNALGVQLALGDIRDAAAVAAACQGCELVYHTAAVAGIWGPWKLFYETNTLGTQHVLAGCRAAGVRLIGPNSLGLLNVETGLHATQSAAGAFERAADAVDRAVDRVAVDALTQEPGERGERPAHEARGQIPFRPGFRPPNTN